MTKEEREWFKAWTEQSKEWQEIADELIAASSGEAVVAYEVTLEQKKRALATGKKLVSYDDLLKIKAGPLE